jgi:hypothetical protein
VSVGPPSPHHSWTGTLILAGGSLLIGIGIALRKRIIRIADSPTSFEVQDALVRRLEADVDHLRDELRAAREETRLQAERFTAELLTARSENRELTADLHAAREELARIGAEVAAMRASSGGA